MVSTRKVSTPMSDIPSGVTQPQDHLSPAIETEPADDQLLAGLPALTPANKLRLRKRNQVLRFALRVAELAGIDLEGDGTAELDLAGLGTERMAGVMDVLAELDEWVEANLAPTEEIRAAYVEWAEKADFAAMSALMSRYSSAVGESSGSSS